MKPITFKRKLLVRDLKLNNFTHNDNILYTERLNSTSSSWTWKIIFKFRGEYYLTLYTEFIACLGRFGNSWEDKDEIKCYRLKKGELNAYMGRMDEFS